ncbi:MAG TPA: hypothetical protein PLE50_04395, partial [Rhabdaerophilum sp.]|nr:hypothetical protein [Rhabdaerophilum sp.]
MPIETLVSCAEAGAESAAAVMKAAAVKVDFIGRISPERMGTGANSSTAKNNCLDKLSRDFTDAHRTGHEWDRPPLVMTEARSQPCWKETRWRARRRSATLSKQQFNGRFTIQLQFIPNCIDGWMTVHYLIETGIDARPDPKVSREAGDVFFKCAAWPPDVRSPVAIRCGRPVAGGWRARADAGSSGASAG